MSDGEGEWEGGGEVGEEDSMSIASSALDSSECEGDGSGGEWDGYSTSSSDEADEDGSDAGTEEEDQGAGSSRRWAHAAAASEPRGGSRRTGVRLHASVCTTFIDTDNINLHT